MKHKLVRGIGINDADYVVQPTIMGKKVWCPFYRAWHGMIERCYSEKLHQNHPTYIGCSACEEWLTFSNFKRWMIQQDWEGKCLDKDLLFVGNKMYSPYTCIFVVQSLNKLLTDCTNKKGSFPLGVSQRKDRGGFQAQVRLKGKQVHLGYFCSTESAHKAWQAAKLRCIYCAIEGQIDKRLKDALLMRCCQLKFDLDNALETIQV